MKRGVLLMLTILTFAALTLPVMAVSAENGVDVQHVEGRTYSFSVPGASEAVAWDFGGGYVVISKTAVIHTFALSGSHTVKARVTGKTYTENVMIYDSERPLVATADRELRYAPRIGLGVPEASAGMIDGSNNDWFFWDSSLGCARGIPPAPGNYIVSVGVPGAAESWHLRVNPSETAEVSAAFSVTADGLNVKTKPVSDYDTALYFWSVWDSTGRKVTLSSEKAPVLTMPSSGMYVIHLKMATAAGPAEYAQVIDVVESQETDQQEHDWGMYGIAALAVLAFILLVRFI